MMGPTPRGSMVYRPMACFAMYVISAVLLVLSGWCAYRAWRVEKL